MEKIKVRCSKTGLLFEFNNDKEKEDFFDLWDKYEVIEEKEIICPRCKGEMRIKDYQADNDSEDGKMPCPTCEGNGKITEDEL